MNNPITAPTCENTPSSSPVSVRELFFASEFNNVGVVVVVVVVVGVVVVVVVGVGEVVRESMEGVEGVDGSVETGVKRDSTTCKDSNCCVKSEM